MKLHSLVRMLVVFQVPGHNSSKFKMVTQMEGPTTLGSPRFCLEKSHSQPMWFRWLDHIVTAWNGPALASINEHMLPLGQTLRMKMDLNNEIFYEVSGREVPFSARLE